MALRWYSVVVDCADVKAQAAWWAEAKESARFARDYAFLPDLIPAGEGREVRRAMATIGLGELLGDDDDHDHDSVQP